MFGSAVSLLVQRIVDLIVLLSRGRSSYIFFSRHGHGFLCGVPTGAEFGCIFSISAHAHPMCVGRTSQRHSCSKHVGSTAVAHVLLLVLSDAERYAGGGCKHMPSIGPIDISKNDGRTRFEPYPCCLAAGAVGSCGCRRREGMLPG